MASDVSKLWLRACPTIRYADTAPNSILGAVVAGRALLGEELDFVLSTMVACGVDIEARDDLGFTPLHSAILYREPRAVAQLLKLGANKQARLTGQAAEKFGAMDSIEFAAHPLNTNDQIITLLSQYR